MKSLRPNKSSKRTKTDREVFKSTDFASKGLYKITSTVGGPTDLNRWIEMRQSWEAPQDASHFKETANLRLSGDTFDCNHLSNFMQKNSFATSPPPLYLEKIRASKD